MVFPGVMYGWVLDDKESWVVKNWCFWAVVLEKTLENLWDCKEIQLVHPRGIRSWMFIGRTDAEAQTPTLWPPDAKNWLIWKDSDAGKDWRWEEKGMTEDETVGWHHRLNGHELDCFTKLKENTHTINSYICLLKHLSSDLCVDSNYHLKLPEWLPLTLS